MVTAHGSRYAYSYSFYAYTIGIVKRTSLNLDLVLVQAAKAILHTSETTETIHRALADVVRHDRLRRLTERRFELSDEELAELRRSRTDGSPPVSPAS